MKSKLSLSLVALLSFAPVGDLFAGDGTNTSTVVTHVGADQAAQLVKRGGVIVIDLRTPEEFAAGHITGATNIDCKAEGFEKRLNALDREKTYVVHCGSGRRSTNALPIFEEKGFKQIAHLDGGLKAWSAAKQPVVKD